MYIVLLIVDNSELLNIEHVPYLVESDCLLTESANLSKQVSTNNIISIL